MSRAKKRSKDHNSCEGGATTNEFIWSRDERITNDNRYSGWNSI